MQAITTEIEEQLSQLGYTKDWVLSGALSLDFLTEQTKHFSTRDDKSTEHYRYSAFKQLISGKREWCENELARYILLAQQDKDPVMAGAALVDLLRCKGLTKTQWETVSEALSAFGPWTHKVIQRERLLRTIETESISEDLFETILASQDAVVQAKCLAVVNVHQLQKLSADGANKSIRKQAKEQLKK